MSKDKMSGTPLRSNNSKLISKSKLNEIDQYLQFDYEQLRKKIIETAYPPKILDFKNNQHTQLQITLSNDPDEKNQMTFVPKKLHNNLQNQISHLQHHLKVRNLQFCTFLAEIKTHFTNEQMKPVIASYYEHLYLSLQRLKEEEEEGFTFT